MSRQRIFSLHAPCIILHPKQVRFPFLGGTLRSTKLTIPPTRTDEIGKHTLYPYVHSFSNIPSRSALLRPVSIPDVLPSALPPGSDFSLVAG